ncbi:MAG: PaaI family thioesterase [Prevotella sp.]|jgi:uncharacterized protein (TIGR00369 family)|nr:PaaI family thioesterase [Prevotella sp.]
MRLDANIKERIKNTFLETLNITFIESDDPTSLEAIMPVTGQTAQTMGILHGGATISLAESLAGIGSNSVCAGDERCFGMQISASHISSANVGDVVRAKGVIQHKGRSTHVWNINVFSDNTGRLVSSIRITNAVVKQAVYSGKGK